MEKAPVGHHVHFTMNGVKYAIPSQYHLTSEEFCPMLYYTRRLLGYIVYPRWFITRMFLSEVIEMMKKNKFYKFELKKITGNMLKEFDLLESQHLQDFDREFVEVLAANLSNLGMKKVNELRGSVGGVLMQAGMKQYVLYSYPYTLLNLCYDNMVCFNQCMNQVKIKYGVDFTDVFKHLKGLKVYMCSIQLMDQFSKVRGEKVGRISFEGTGCREKLGAINNILLKEANLKNAFQEAYEEVSDESKKEVFEEMSIWEDDRDELLERLSEKYTVKPL
jgi:hypothetical protein